MALNMTHKYTKTETWPVEAGVVSGDPVLSETDQPAFAITSRGDATESQAFGPYTISGIPTGGVGNLDDQAVVAVDGAARWPVTGVTNATERNTPVFAVKDVDGIVTELTLVDTGNVPFGKIDRVIAETDPTEASVWIGVYVEATA